jgi:hypothetical protein
VFHGVLFLCARLLAELFMWPLGFKVIDHPFFAKPAFLY